MPAAARPRKARVPVAPASGTGVREAAAQATRDSILRAAIKVFARHGYDGGSVEKISRAARSYDRMIYYYFGSKEGLFIEVIEQIYRRFNEAEAALSLDLRDPVDALEGLVRFMVRYYRQHPEFVTLLNTENLHRGRHIAKSERARDLSLPALGRVGEVLARGAAAGRLRKDLSARDLYLTIAALGYFYQSNRYTLSAFLGEDLEDEPALSHWEDYVVDTVLRTATVPAARSRRAR